MSRMGTLYVATGAAVVVVLGLVVAARLIDATPPSVVAPVAGSAVAPTGADAGRATASVAVADVDGARPASAVTGPQRAPSLPDSAQRAAPFDIDPWTYEVWNEPIDLVLPDLLTRAEAGDRDAQFALGGRLSECTGSRLEALRSRVARGRDNLARETARDDRDGLREQRLHGIQFGLDQIEARLASCERVPAEVSAAWLSWIERAATAGSANARVQYWRYAAEEYADAAAVIRDAAEAARRREQARVWLAAELARGNHHALEQLGQDAGYTLGYPAAQNAAWLWALRLSEQARAGEPIRLDHLQTRFTEATSTLDPAARAAIQAEGERIYRACCVPRG